MNTRLDWAATRIELPAGRYETILPPTAVADLMLDAYWTASARDAEEGRSVYARSGGKTRIGERLSELPLTLRSDPDEPGLSCAPFEVATASAAGLQSVFDNGAPLEAARWITDGKLTELIRTRSWAARTGAPSRLFVDNLILDGAGTASLDDMIANTERGLLLTSLWYIREVDPQTLLLTGLTRDGVYLVENGTIQGAVNNFRFNESPVDPARSHHRDRTHGADAAARMGGLLHPSRDAPRTSSRLQHVDREPGLLIQAAVSFILKPDQPKPVHSQAAIQHQHRVPPHPGVEFSEYKPGRRRSRQRHLCANWQREGGRWPYRPARRFPRQFGYELVIQRQLVQDDAALHQRLQQGFGVPQG